LVVFDDIRALRALGLFQLIAMADSSESNRIDRANILLASHLQKPFVDVYLRFVRRFIRCRTLRASRD
jgi:hypothetical protein